MEFGHPEFLHCGEAMDPTTDPHGRFTHTCAECGHSFDDATVTTPPTPITPRKGD
jgi:hypothetical protein